MALAPVESLVIVREYRMSKSGGRPIRQQYVERPEHALRLDWLVRERGAAAVEETDLGYWIVTTGLHTVVALIFKN